MSPARRDPADRRAELLEAALAVAEADGLDRLGAAAVAARAGASKPLVFHYFGTAAGLRRAVAATAVDDARAALTTDAAPPAPPAGPATGAPDTGAPATGAPDTTRAAARLTAFLDSVVAHRHTWLAVWQGALAGDDETEAALADLRGTLVERVTAGLGVPPAAGPQARLLTQGWVALVERVVAAWLEGGSGVSRAEVERLVLESFRVLAGYLAGGPDDEAARAGRPGPG
ncbi:TetR family transcriptional regulator [Puerhibacterium puerhi]|uniref:TetR family transcriptional regulator n=1 Tax=Puerhibacterium puerhi TaxID=2692623 RepID=UPI00135923D3|nr:TetR family transcriptional regulator [Puerhibacterium puerhi]